MTDRPIGIDLFAGAGGLSLGFEQAGFEVVAAVEIDPIHAAVHKYNFPNCAVIARSVVGLSGTEIRSLAGIGRRPVDVVFGGAPCQGFSLIGQRSLDDPRNFLVKEFVRIVVELKAKTFVFENVKGLTLGKHRAFLEALIDVFDEAGYKVQIPWRVLNAKDYGVPQHRERLFLLGARKGTALPTYPHPLGAQPRGRKSGGSERVLPTCADAISDLPDAELFPELVSSDSAFVGKWKVASDYARELRCESSGAWHYSHPRRWEPHMLTASMRSEHTDISRRRFASTEVGTTEPISRFLKLDPNGICNTLRAGTDSARGAFTSPRPIHFKFPRCITVREMARLHGYPDWFRFHVTKWHGARQIGNSVPPPLARAVAGSIIEALRVAPACPRSTIELGSTELLSMDMREAAAYWGVPALIARRDRKSGLRKRKQSEIEEAKNKKRGAR